VTSEVLVASSFGFKDGVGIADPGNVESKCTALLLGVRGIPPAAESWEQDQNMGTNLNGPGVGISNLVPLLNATGGWLSGSGGIDLGIPCPIPGPSPGNLWLVWSGMNWRTAEADSFTRMFLCTEGVPPFYNPAFWDSGDPAAWRAGIPRVGGPNFIGCLPLPNGNLKLIASACTPGTDSFSADYTDRVDTYFGSFDALLLQNDRMTCAPVHSHDYTSTVQEFESGLVAQTFDLIKNEAVVHSGSVAAQSGGTRVATYMAVCWRVDYVDFRNPLAPVMGTAHTHDWKLVFDLGSLASLGIAAPAALSLAVQEHYGGQLLRDGAHVGGPTVAMRGFYSGVGETPAPASRFGPCPFSAPLPETKKPSSLI
jgi:hypothetical protein